MSHDRGCSCGREAGEYRTCPKRQWKNCSKESVIAVWDQRKPDMSTLPNGGSNSYKAKGDFNSITDADVKQYRDFPSMDMYQYVAIKTAIYPGVGTHLGMSYVLHKLAGEAGEANEHFGKAQRDEGLIELLPTSFAASHEVHFRDYTPARREALIKELGDVLWYISAASKELGMTLSQVAEANLVKLNDRTKRGKLSGSGDNR